MTNLPEGELMLCEPFTLPDSSLLAFIPGIPGPLELIVVAGIILLLFGKRLPEVMGSLGRSIVEFKKGASEIDGPSSEDPPPAKTSES